MDRQTKIAFGLIFILFIAYFLYMSRLTPSAPAPTGGADSLLQADTEERVPAVADQFQGGQQAREDIPPPADIAEAAFEAAPRRRLVVETPIARYHLDSQGAMLTRIELLEYEGVGTEFVELIAAREEDYQRAVLGVDFELDRGWTHSVEWNFVLDGPDFPAEETLRVQALDERSGEFVEADYTFARLKLPAGAEETLHFRASDGQGGELIKSYTFTADSYEFLLVVDTQLQGSLAGTRSLAVDWTAGLLSTEKNRKDDVRSFKNSFRVGDQKEVKNLGNFKEGNGFTSSGIRSSEGTLQWVATKNKYFIAALVPDQLMSGQAVLVGDKEAEYLGWRAEYSLRGGRQSFGETFRVYAGPMIYHDLKVYGRELETTVDMGWPLIRPISVGIKWLMDFLNRFIPNYGLIIIILSILTKVLFYRLTHKSFKSMKEMQNLQPELKAIQEKYKNNKEQLNKAMMGLYKEHGVNPLGGCLPLLLQMPVFFALYQVLRGAVELRGAGFMLWMDNLSTPDVLATMPFSLPVLGNAISVLPILMGLSMWVQQKFGGSGMGMGGGGGQAAGQMAVMNKIMPFFMTIIFYGMPSGLVLYWLVNNILTAVQQYYIHKGLDDTPKVVPANA